MRAEVTRGAEAVVARVVKAKAAVMTAVAARVAAAAWARAVVCSGTFKVWR